MTRTRLGNWQRIASFDDETPKREDIKKATEKAVRRYNCIENRIIVRPSAECLRKQGSRD